MVAQDMLVRVADHLWQSTLVAAACGVACLLLRHHAARVRHRLWLAAILKFGVPFAALEAMGRAIPEWRAASPSPDNAFTAALYQLAAPAREAQATTAAAPGSYDGGPSSMLTFAILAVWAVGFVACLARAYVGWRAVRGCLASGEVPTRGRELAVLRRLDRGESVGLVLSSGAFEPGVVGVRRPVLVWPSLLSARMSDDEIAAVMAHELEHVRRQDNLAGLGDMVVRCVFWFYPVVWWLGTRLLAERERACDEVVIERQSAQVYAESILKTCEFCLESPVVFVAGVTGADLKHRIAAIVRGPVRKPLSRRAATGICACVALLLVGPIGVGAFSARPRISGWSELSAQTQSETNVLLRFDVASVKRDTSREGPANPWQQSPNHIDYQNTQVGGLTQAPRPTFEVASIKRNMSGSRGSGQGVRPGGNFLATNQSLLQLMRSAYNVRESQIAGGPDWIREDRFDVTAKASTDVPPDQVRLMVQTLLEDRFKLRFRTERREMPLLELVLARSDGQVGPNLHDCSNAEDKTGISSSEKPFRAPPGGAVAAGDCAGVAAIANLASTMLQALVVDKTGLAGQWRYDIYFGPDLPSQESANPSVPSFIGALSEQLGLKLERTRGLIDVLVIDSVQQPTEN